MARFAKSICGLLLISGVLVSVGSVRAQEGDDNPFRSGTTKYRIPPEHLVEYQAITRASKRRLSTGMAETAGKSLEQTNATLLNTIREVVIQSYKTKVIEESPMRQTLSLALKLTYGVPTKTGVGIESPGILVNTENPDLLTAILEGSMNLAIRLAEEDLAGPEVQSLVKFPYVALAREHLLLVHDWLGGETNDRAAFEVAVLGLHHFIRLMDSENNLDANTFGEIIDRVNSKLEALPEGCTLRSAEIQFQYRELLGLIDWTLDSVAQVQKRIAASGRDNGDEKFKK